MGMKKFLCAIIGLLFAVPSFANCNLLPVYNTSPETVHGVTFTPQPDGSIIINGSVNDDSEYANYIVARAANNLVLPAGTYTISGVTGGSSSTYILDLYGGYMSGNGVADFFDTRASDPITQTATSEWRLGMYAIRIMRGYTANNLVVRPMIERGSTATPYTPYNPLCETCDGTVVNYTSATGTVTQNGTPTPTNPITPVFYTQGNMVLRKVGDYADTYDATTGKITRKVGVLVLTGNETWTKFSDSNPNNIGTFYTSLSPNGIDINGAPGLSTHFPVGASGANGVIRQELLLTKAVVYVRTNKSEISDETQLNQWLAEQYAAGTPVVVYYQLAEAVEETVPASYCQQNIRVATTKYVETEFSALNTALANAVATVNTVVTQTIAQAASIATLQSGKQTRPDETCPAGKKCLLVTDENNIPHWYEICSSAHCLPAGYTELEYIQSTGAQWTDTGNVSTGSDRFVSLWNSINASGNKTFYGASNGSIATGERSLFWMDTSGIGVDLVWPTGADTGTYQHIAGAWGASGDYLFDDNLTSFTYNGTSVSRSVSRNFTSRYHLFLFAVSRNGVDPIAVSNVRLKYFKWYRNDELIHEYIPAKRNSDGVIGLYDTVNNRFYTNAGTGTFIAGQVAE